MRHVQVPKKATWHEVVFAYQCAGQDIGSYIASLGRQVTSEKKLNSLSRKMITDLEDDVLRTLTKKLRALVVSDSFAGSAVDGDDSLAHFQLVSCGPFWIDGRDEDRNISES